MPREGGGRQTDPRRDGIVWSLCGVGVDQRRVIWLREKAWVAGLCCRDEIMAFSVKIATQTRDIYSLQLETPVLIIITVLMHNWEHFGISILISFHPVLIMERCPGSHLVEVLELELLLDGVPVVGLPPAGLQQWLQLLRPLVGAQLHPLGVRTLPGETAVRSLWDRQDLPWSIVRSMRDRQTLVREGSVSPNGTLTSH